MSSHYRVAVLAGERAAHKGLAARFDVPASVLVPVAGKSCLERVLECIASSEHVQGGVLCGPASPELLSGAERDLMHSAGLTWQRPTSGPAASALQATAALDLPVVITTADHALLRPATLDAFCEAVSARSQQADCFVGLVDHGLVQAAYPQTRRTRLRFADGERCGSNLFAITSCTGLQALHFWRKVENARKQPWRIAQTLGLRTLMCYLSGRLSASAAMQRIGARAGCRVDWVDVADARGAIDVDDYEDWLLAEQILRQEAQPQAQ